MRTATRLARSLDALAALAASQRVEAEGLEVDPRTRELLAAVADEVVGDSSDVPEAGRNAVVGMTRAFLRQAADLVENPGRLGGWDQPDPVLLQGLGRLSAAIVDGVRAAEGVLDGLGSLLDSSEARFLDVGTGTGWLAIAMARAYPELSVVGIDIFEPSLGLARQNVTEVGLDDRVELRLQEGADLDDVDPFDLVWLPMPFLPIDVVPRVVDSAAKALRPGGWLLAGTFAGSDERLSELLVELHMVRSGGHPWTAAELTGLITDHGMADACEVPRTWAAPVRLYAGRKP